MRVSIPLTLFLCAASAGVAFFLGRTSRSVESDERQAQSGGVAVAPGLSVRGNAARAEGASNSENSDELLEAFRDVYGKPFAKDRVARLRELVAKMDVASIEDAELKGRAASAIVDFSKLSDDPERLGALFERFPDSRDMMGMLPTSA